MEMASYCIQPPQAAIPVQTGLQLGCAEPRCARTEGGWVSPSCLNAGHSSVGEGENEKS